MAASMVFCMLMSLPATSLREGLPSELKGEKQWSVVSGQLKAKAVRFF
jgi:hypothetical protein